MEELNLDNPQELSDEQIDAIAGGRILYRDVDRERIYRVIDAQGNSIALTRYLETARRMAQKRGTSLVLINDAQYEALYGRKFQVG